MQAYSVPITPPPTTIIDLGSVSSLSRPSEVKMVFSSNGTLAGLAGPGAGGDDEEIGAEHSKSSGRSTKITFSSSKRAAPQINSTSLRSR